MITFTQPTATDNTYKDARFARDEFTNSTNPDKAPYKIVEGLNGIRLQKTAGSEVEFDNVKVYTDKSYNDFQDFNGKENGTSVPGWYFAGTQKNCNYMYNGHRPESRISAVDGKTGVSGDKALKLNNDSTLRYYIHPFEIPIKATTKFDLEFDVKNESGSNAIWMLALMEEAYMHQNGANTMPASGTEGIAENGEVGTASDGNAFMRRNILSNFVWENNAYSFNKIGYSQSASAWYATNITSDTGLTLENGEWNHIKLSIEPVSSTYGSDFTVTVTDKDGNSKTSSKLRMHTRGDRFYNFDTYGCGFYTNGCTIDNLKVTQATEEYKSTVTSINSIDVRENKNKLDATIGTDELQLEVNLSAPAKTTDDITLYYSKLAEGQRPEYTIHLQDNGYKALIDLTNVELGEDITICVSNKADIGTTYISKPATTFASFKVVQAESEFNVTDFRLYEYVDGRTYQSGSKTFSCEGAWVPIMRETLDGHTDFNNLKLVAKGYNTGDEREVSMIAGFYKNEDASMLDSIVSGRKTISQGNFNEEYLIENQETIGNRLKIFMWQPQDIQPLADSMEYSLN